MARPKAADQEGAGSDSFLDIITNLVGILIILVMVVGERAKTAPVELPAPAPNQALTAARAESQQLEDDVHRLAAQMAEIQAATQAKAIERGRLSVLVTAIEKDMDQRRQALDDEARKRFEYDREMAQARDELKRLEAEQEMAEQAAKPETVKIENHPTPLGKLVDSDEAHLRLYDGRLAVLPYETLMGRLRGELRSAVNEMGSRSEMVDTLGPIEGFRLRYVIQRHDMPQGSLFELAYVEFLPVTNQLGEPLDQALKSGSDFRRTLSRLSPERYTITIWTYPDSFAEFARLKKELYDMGYTVAARPLPDGMPIGASPNGSKSSAQ